jgi:hypothetical protein
VQHVEDDSGLPVCDAVQHVEDDSGLPVCDAVQPDKTLANISGEMLSSYSGYHIAENSVPHFDVIVKLVFVLCFMIPGNNDALTSFVERVALCNSVKGG